MVRNTPSRWQIAITIIIIMGLVGFLIWGIYKIRVLFWDYISHSQPTIGAAIIATSGTVLVSVFSIVVARFFEKKKELGIKRHEIEHEIREKHMPTYQELVQFLFKIFQSSKTGVNLSQQEINDFFTEFMQKIFIWGSDRFIRILALLGMLLVSMHSSRKMGKLLMMT